MEANKETEVLVEKKEKGAGMVEYALLVALIGIALIGALQALQGQIGTTTASAVSGLAAS